MTAASNKQSQLKSKEQYPEAAAKLTLFNTLGGKKEVFNPLDNAAKPVVKMYVCGLTPYDSAHMGHIVPALRFDLLRNYLEYRNLEVNFVQNVTDIDDKIINRVLETGEDPYQLTTRVVDSFYKHLAMMHVRMPNRIIKVTESMPQIIKYIEEMITKGAAYATSEGNVYFDISKKADYGKLSNQRVAELQEGVRIDSETDKRSPLDFALWKNDSSSKLSCNSPWGVGRPGWHIECSVMIDFTLGTPIDIHGGGLDLKFPHHENEIAQSEAHDGHDFAKYWMHAGLLTIDGTKMSKSLGNFLTVEDAFEKYGPELIRFVFLIHHYRSNVNLSDQLFLENLNGLWDFYKLLAQVEARTEIKFSNEEFESVKELRAKFEEALNDDLNSPLVVVALRKAASTLRQLLQSGGNESEISSLAYHLREFGRVLGLFYFSANEILEQAMAFAARLKSAKPLGLEELRDLLNLREKVRAEKNYAEADKIRAQLSAVGLEYLDAKKSDAPTDLLLNLRFLVPSSS